MDASAGTITRYDGRTILLHWLTAGLIVALWCMGQTIDWFPRPLRPDARSAHFTVGLILGVVLVLRIRWRATSGRILPNADPGLLGLVAKAVHYLLYALVIGEVALGICNAWFRGDSYFGLFGLPGYRPLRGQIEWLHAQVATAILIVVGLHALAALAHHYVLRDNVLRRMWAN
jgi:cytochrome b561